MKKLVMALILLAGRAYAQTDSQVTQIFNDFKPAALVFNIHLGQLIFSPTANSHVSNGDPNIIVNLDQINQYTRGRSQEFRHQFVKYVIAHEIGHKVQFNGYRKEVVAASRGEGTVFLECNADLLAGIILNNELNGVEITRFQAADSNFDVMGYNEKIAPVMAEVYRSILKMDQQNLDITTHPNTRQRLLAVKEGVILGNCYLLANAVPDSRSNTPQYAQYKELYRLLGKAINYDAFSTTNNNPLTWAHAEAVLITNENNQYAKNIVRYATKTKRNRTPDGTRLTYSFRLWNENPVSVQVVGRVYTEMVPRDAPGDQVNRLPLDAAVFDQTIPAGGSVLVSGELDYSSTVKYSTHIVFPGDPQSLYYVFASDKQNIDESDRESSDNDFTVWGNNSVEAVNDLVNDMVLKSDHFGTYLKGISVSSDSTYKGFTRYSRNFEPTFKAGNEDDQYFSYSEVKKVVSYHLNACSMSDSVSVLRHFGEINARVKSSIRTLTPQPLDTSDGDAVQDYVDSAGRNKVRVVFQKDYTSTNYVVKIIVYGSY